MDTTSGEILETTTCDRCDYLVGLTKDHVPDDPVTCKECGGPWARMPVEAVVNALLGLTTTMAKRDLLRSSCPQTRAD